MGLPLPVSCEWKRCVLSSNEAFRAMHWPLSSPHLMLTWSGYLPWMRNGPFLCGATEISGLLTRCGKLSLYWPSSNNPQLLRETESVTLKLLLSEEPSVAAAKAHVSLSSLWIGVATGKAVDLALPARADSAMPSPWAQEGSSHLQRKELKRHFRRVAVTFKWSHVETPRWVASSSS